MISPQLVVNPEDIADAWLTIDLRDDVDVGHVVVIPCYGMNHHAGMDCWCDPSMTFDGIISHNSSN